MPIDPFRSATSPMPFAPSHPTVPSVAAHDDLSTLAWVHDALRKTLESAHKGLRRYLREVEAAAQSDLDDVEPTILRNARQNLHEGVGALQLVNLPEGATLLRAAEAAVQRFVAKPQRLDVKGVEAIERASFALLDYLSRRLAGKAAPALALFPQLRALLELNAAHRIHPADLWAHDWRWRAVSLPPGVPHHPDASVQADVERRLLALVKQNTPEAAAALARAFHAIALDAPAARRHEAALWAIGGAFFEAWGRGLIEPDLFVKRTASRVMAALRARVKGDLDVSERLAQDLLFFCARARPVESAAAPLLAAVRRAHGFGDGQPLELTGVDYNEPRYGRHDPALITQARKRITAAKEAWNGAAGPERQRVASLIETFTLVGDSIRKLCPGGGRLAEVLLAVAGQSARASQPPEAELAMEVATSLLYLDAALDEGEFDQPGVAERTAKLAGRIERVAARAPAEPLETWMEELYRRASDRQTMGSVVQELRSSLAEAERQIDQFFRSPVEAGLLAPVPGLLSSMRGVFSVLAIAPAVQAVLRMRDDVELLLHGDADPQGEDTLAGFHRLAGNLGALGFLIDMLGVQPQMAAALFRFDAGTGLLAPLMGRHSAGAELAGRALAIAEAARQGEVPLDQVSAELAALSQARGVHGQPELADRLNSAQAALSQAAEGGAGEATADAARAHVARALDDFVATANGPVGLEPLGLPMISRPMPLGGQEPPAFVPTGLEDDDEMRGVFLEESAEVLADAQAALAELSGHPTDLSAMTTVRRAFHTLKGSARMVGFPAFGEAAWSCEQLYNHALAEQAPASAHLRTLTADALGYFADWVSAIGHGTEAPFSSDPVVAAADTLRLAGELLRVHRPGADQPIALAQVDEVVHSDLVDLEVPFDDSGAPVLETLQATQPVRLSPPELAPLDPDAAELAALQRAFQSSDLALDLDLGDSADAAPAPRWDRTAPLPPEAVPASFADAIESIEVIDLTTFDALPGEPEGVAFTPPAPFDGFAPARVDPLAQPVADVPADAPAGFAPASDLMAFDGEVDLPPDTDTDRLAPFGTEPVRSTEGSVWPQPDASDDDVPAFDSVESFDTSWSDAPPTRMDEAFTMVAELGDLPLGRPADDIDPEPVTEPLVADAAASLPMGFVPSLLGTDLGPADLELVEPESPSVPEFMPESGSEGALADEPIPVAEIGTEFSDEAAQGVVDGAGTAPGAAIYRLEDFRPASEPGPVDDGVKVIGTLRLPAPLFNIYLNEADELSRRLSDELSLWALELERPVGVTASTLAHSLAGNSAAVGFTALSQLARDLEHSLARSEQLRAGIAADAQLFGAVADEIRRLLHQFAAGFLQAPPPDLVERLRSWQIEALERTPVRSAESRLGDSTLDGQSPPTDFNPFDASGNDAAGLIPAELDLDLGPTEAPLTLPAEPQDRVDAELFPIFDEEAQELLPQLTAQVAQWRRTPTDPRAATGCMRTLHTFKGSARLAGAMRLGELAHQFESAIEELVGRSTVRRDDAPDALALHATDLDALQQRADALSAAFDEVRRAHGVGALPAGGPSSALGDWMNRPLVLPDARTGYGSITQSAPLDALSGDGAADASGGLSDAAASAFLPDRLPGEAATQAAPVDGLAGAPAGDAIASIDWARFLAESPPMPANPVERAPVNTQPVRVRAPLLDRLVNLAGEVSITRSRLESEVGSIRNSLADLNDNLERLKQQLRDIGLQADTQLESRLEAARAAAQVFDPLELDRYTRLQELTRMMAESVNDVGTVRSTLQRTLQTTEDELAVQARLTRELQGDLLRTRMLEFESLSERLNRVVRQAATETGKQVRFDIVGGSIEVDRGVLDRMTAAFEHLLRNCVTHGIERPEQRQALGKDPTGSVVVTLEQEGNEVSVEIRDDGAGLDLARIRERAQAMGLVTPDATLSDKATTDLIFAPGLSTASSVTELAGRGVGLDVVRADVQAMGGRIETRSLPGRNTRFKLVLPLTTVVTQVVLLRAGATAIAVPSNLIELVQRATLGTIEEAYVQGEYDYGGMPLPFFWLGALLDASGRGTQAGRTLPVVIVRSAQQRVALHLDEVLGTHEVVVKNLGPQLSRLPGLAGMTLLATGAAALIYNPVALAAIYGERAWALMRRAALPLGADAAAFQSTTSGEGVRPAPLVLVVDDSLTVRRVTKRLLEREGYRVGLAKDGLEALDALSGERPVAVLSDIEMPRMDGFDLLRNIRADAELSALPVIMITSRIAQKHRELAFELGADHYLGKPYNEDELLGLLRPFVATGTRVPS